MSTLIDKMRNLVYGLSYLVAVLFAVAIVGYIIKTNFGEDGEPVGFQLATIAAVIGGLVVVFGICFPLIEVSWYFMYASAIGIVAGAFSFAMGSVLLAMKVPQLWSSS